jgi:hypothetical protein
MMVVKGDVAVNPSPPTILLIGYLAAAAHAESCVIKNPYNEMTNVRDSPRGAAILKRLKNGNTVQFITTGKDQLGSDWGKITMSENGARGWVLREYLDCAARDAATVATRPMSPPPALAPGSEATATAANQVDLKCELHGECSGLRLGIQSDDHSCPNGLNVSDGDYRVALNYRDAIITISHPDMTQTTLHMACSRDKCEGVSHGILKTTKWTHAFIVTNANNTIYYTYNVISEFGEGVSFMVMHIYRGSCTREPSGSGKSRKPQTLQHAPSKSAS